MNSPMPTTDPLAELRPLHLPESSLWWPPAPGWWILTLLLIATIWFGLRWWQKGQIRRTTLKLLENLNRQSLSATDYAGAINQILKRYCLAYFSHDEVAGLTGKPWQDFLDLNAPGDNVRLGAQLGDMPYQADAQSLDRETLYREARRWIRSNPPKGYR